MSGTATIDRPRPAPRWVRRRGRREQLVARLGTWQIELLVVVALFALAAAARWPYLLRLPHFTDEVGEVRWALRIWRGEALPLTAQVQYMGPYHHYLLAAALWLFGPQIVLPRLLVLLVGALTVVLTYLLGRELAGPKVGLLAAALLATSPQHIVVNSHVAWQNSTTPLYSTLSLWALARALRLADRGRGAWGRGGPWLLLSGLGYGIALGTHLGLAALAPALVGSVVYFLWRHGAWRLLRGPWPYTGMAAALAAYSPLLVANLRAGMAGYWRAQGRDYAYVARPTWDTYRHNLANLLGELARDLSNPFRLPARPLHYLTSPYLLAAVALCLLGLALLARRGQPLPLLALASAAAIMPYFNRAYGVEGDRYLLTGRYVAFLLPPLLVAGAAGALALAGTAQRAVPRRWRRPLAAGAGVLLGLLVLYPLQPLERYYTHEARLDPDNATFLATVRLLEAARGPRTPIWLDRYLDHVDLKDGAEALDVLDALLILDGVPHAVVDDPAAELRRVGPALDPADTGALPLVVMMRDRCFRMGDPAPFQRISDRLLLRELYLDLPSYYAVYRAAPPPQPAGCFDPSGPRAGD